MKKDTFGIDLKKWSKAHESAVTSAIEDHSVTEDLLEKHKERVLIMQHERLIHLIVTAMTVIVELFVVWIVLIHPEFGIVPAIIMLGFTVLLGFYFSYYFFLENTVQRWYRLTDEMQRELDEANKANQMYGEYDDARR